MPAWTLKLSENDLDSLAMLWQVPGVEALRLDDLLWLRGGEPDDAVRRLLCAVPCLDRFEILAEGALLKSGSTVPLGYLPNGPWQPLNQFLSVSLPSAGVPSNDVSRVHIDIVPSERMLDPNVLVTDLESWFQYGQDAPQIRLRGCQFAVCGDGRTLIHGTPLPPLAGTRAIARAGLVVPCGWEWSPAVPAELLAAAWGVTSGDLWLLWPGKAIEHVLADHLIAANHAAIRSTWEALQIGRNS